MTARRAAQQRLVDAEVAAGVENGRMRTPHAREASRAVVTLCKSIAEWYNPAGPFTPEDIAERYVQFALGLVRHVEILDLNERLGGGQHRLICLLVCSLVVAGVEQQLRLERFALRLAEAEILQADDFARALTDA